VSNLITGPRGLKFGVTASVTMYWRAVFGGRGVNLCHAVRFARTLAHSASGDLIALWYEPLLVAFVCTRCRKNPNNWVLRWVIPSCLLSPELGALLPARPETPRPEATVT